MAIALTKLQDEFRAGLLQFANTVHGFDESTLELERLVLSSCHRSTRDTQGIFTVPQSTLSRETSWRVKYRLLDIVYGEPTAEIIRCTSDLKNPLGELHVAWSSVRETPSDHRIQRLTSVIDEYENYTFRPRHRSCLRLWNSLGPDDVSLLSSDVRDVWERAIGQLHDIDAAFRRIVNYCHALNS